MDESTDLYGDCIVLVSRLRKERGDDAVLPFTKRWNDVVMKGEVTEEWLEQLKKDLTEILGE